MTNRFESKAEKPRYIVAAALVKSKYKRKASAVIQSRTNEFDPDDLVQLFMKIVSGCEYAHCEDDEGGSIQNVSYEPIKTGEDVLPNGIVFWGEKEPIQEDESEPVLISS